MKMIVDFTNLKKYSKIVTRFKDVTQPIFDSVQIDFANQTVTFGSLRGFGKVKIGVQNIDAAQKPIMINAVGLLAVIEEFPVLEYENYVFSSGTENVFELPHLDDTFEYPSFESTAQAKPLQCTEEIINAIRRAGLYSDDAGSQALNGVFITDGTVAGTNRLRLCEEEIPQLKGISMALSRTVWETLALDVLGADVVLDDSNPQSVILSNTDISLALPASIELKEPPIRDENFIKSYKHETFLKVKKSEFESVAAFMTPFVANAAATRMQLVFSETGLELKTEDNSQRISRKIALIDVSKGVFHEDKIWISNQWLRTVLSSLEGETLVMQVNPSSFAMNFYTEEHPERHIVCCRLSETA